MAVNYDDLFENVGELVQRINDFEDLYAALDTDFSEIESDLQANGRSDVLSGIYQQFEGFKTNINQWIDTLKGKTTEVLTNRTSILVELPGLLGASDINSVLVELYRDMVANSETIDASTVTIGSVTASTANVAPGSLLTTKVLDGFNAPHPGFIVNRLYNGINSELAGVSDTLTIICTVDSESGGATEGQETFQYGGKVAPPNRYHWNSYGSGSGGQISTVQAGGILSNMEFETFTSTNTPSSWDIDGSAVAGTHIFVETSSVHRGDSALKLTGNATITSIQISQTLAANAVQPLRRYLVGFWVLGNASISAGTLTIQFEGTGYTAASSEKIVLNAAALAALTSYTWESFWINMPAEIPDDMELVIKWTGTPSAHSVRIDGGGMGPATYFDGVGFALYAGADKFIRGDRFVFAVTNNNAGTFQEAFRRLYGMQMPSDTGGTETTLDSLAE